MIGSRDFLRNRPLRVEAIPRFGFRQAITRLDAADLFGGLARAHDDGVELVLLAGLEQQRNVGHGHVRAGGKIGGPLLDAAVDLGMDDGFEIGARCAVGEYESPESRPIERAIRAQETVAEPCEHSAESRRTWRDSLPRQPVRVDRGCAERGERAQAKGLACGNAAGERGAHHVQAMPIRARAAATVFLSSIAIVSGPTPPGTGVSAPATHATAG